MPMLVSAALLAAAAAAPEPGASRVLRFPDICGDAVAFVQAGDIYRVAAGGGTAQRLTSHIGNELYPKFSPDCRWIAFSAEYDGTRQVYVIPADGGLPRSSSGASARFGTRMTETMAPSSVPSTR